jgi:multidrug efflux pump subunit AcrA (membrane-fusion protein)
MTGLLVLVSGGVYLFERQSQRNLFYQLLQRKAEATAEVYFAEIEYRNTKSLADSNVVSKNELDLAKAKLDKAKAELAFARVRLGVTKIRAPFDGIMDHFQVRLGSLIEEVDLLTTLSDNSRMWVYFNVPEAEYLDYKVKASKNDRMKVDLLMANHQRFPYPGVVETIEADFNNETGNIAFRATFPNPNGLLRHALIDTALANNQELNVTLQEIEIARNEIRARRGEYLPFVRLGGGVGIEKAPWYTQIGSSEATTDIRPGHETTRPSTRRWEVGGSKFVLHRSVM